ncbi:MAG: hypothetical protein ACJA2J_000697 [Candidatus Azotimanducaceae bacterium]|jgi:hypothetical protein
MNNTTETNKNTRVQHPKIGSNIAYFIAKATAHSSAPAEILANSRYRRSYTTTEC